MLAQTPAFEWAKNFQGNGLILSNFGFSITSDLLGNTYSTGQFGEPLDFDPGSGVLTYTPAGSGDIYITKLNALGDLVWAKRIGSTALDIGRSITIDANGNVYVTGSFQGTVDFDPGSGVVNLSAVQTDAFILKLNSVGDFVFVKQFTGASGSSGTSNVIALDNLNNIYTTGTFKGTFDFDPSATSFTVSSSAPTSSDVFVSKLDPLGNLVWVKKLGNSTDDEKVNGLCTDNAGNVLFAGSFGYTVDFDPGVAVYNLSVPVSTFKNGYIVKLNSLGNFIWANSFSDASNSYVNSIKTDASDNVLVSGDFFGTADFDPSSSSSYSLTSFGQNDGFVTKLNSLGNFIWVKQIGGSSFDNAQSIFVDASNNVYTTGFFSGNADFDPGVSTYSFSSNGNDDIFISKLDDLGNFVFANKMGGSGDEAGLSISVDNNYNVYTTGYFEGLVDFNPNAGVSNLNSIAGYNPFVQKLSQCIAPLAPTNTTSSSNQSICENNTTILSATSTGTVNWYATQTSTIILASGTSYTTSTLSASTYTFYAEASTCTVSATRTPITVTVNALPTLTVNSGSICSGNTFTINPIGANTFTISGGSAIVSPTSNTSYSVTGTSIDGCISSNTAISSVSVNALPTLSVSSSNSLMCIGESATLTVTGANTYTWNTTHNTNAISISPTVTTTYTVSGIDANGCENSSTITQSVSLCTGITLLQKENLNSIYPNPSNGVFTISGIESNSTITVYSMVGKLVFSTISNESFKTIDLTDYSNGIYFVKVISNNNQKTHRLIKH